MQGIDKVFYKSTYYDINTALTYFSLILHYFDKLL